MIRQWTFWQRINYGGMALGFGLLARLFLGWTWIWELVLTLFYAQFVIYPDPPTTVPVVDVPKYSIIIRLVTIILMLSSFFNLFR